MRLTHSLLIGFSLLLAATAVTAQQKEAKPERESPQAVWKSERNFKAVQAAWEMVSEESYAEAEARFRELVEEISDPYEKSQAMFGLAQAMMMRDKFDPALQLYEQIVNMNVLPNRPHFNAIFQIAQLYYMRENYDKSLQWIDRWMRESGEEKEEAYTLKASIYAQREQYRQALENIDIAIGMSEEPKETWYQLKLAMHFELNEFKEAKKVLELLVRNWPDKKTYWTQLTSLNVTLKQDQEALAVLSLAHRRGLLDKEQEWMQLFSLYGYMNVPYKGAKVLEEGIEKGFVEPSKKVYEQLGNAYYAAQELDEAVGALSKAADFSEDGKLDMQVAYILVDQENWSEAKRSLANAIDKGGLSERQMGNLHVLLGMSELNTNNRTAARDAFRKARNYSTTRSTAQQWLNHLDELAKAETGSAGP